MIAGSSSCSALWRLAATGLLAAGFAIAGSAQVAAAQPPTAAQFESRTDSFLDSLESAPQPSLRRAGGGVGGSVDQTPNSPSKFGRSITVALYGSPQLTATAVGKRSPKGAARKLKKQAREYRKVSSRPVKRSINLIGVVALASPGNDRKYRSRQDPKVIRAYLKAARSVGARLMLDIQPGRSPIMTELRALRKWIAMPDVDVGIDPEWNVGKKGVPGSTQGKVTSDELNKASRWIESLLADESLPPKVMIVHQFREGSIKKRPRVKQRRTVAVTLNFDGIGSPAAKKAGYANLAQRGLFDGFSLFYDRDSPLIKPSRVVKLRPRVEYAMYQ